jgi:N-acetylglucosamine-6-phosphate deacetylase
VSPRPLLLYSGSVLDTRRRTIGQHDVLLVDGRVAAVGQGISAPDGTIAIDATDLLIAPGLIDAQVNGAQGIDLTRDPERVGEVAEALLRHGVTSFVATAISSPQGTVERLLSATKDAIQSSVKSDKVMARILGVHAEGPFLCAARRGAHPLDYLRLPDIGLVSGWSRNAGLLVATVAPELTGSTDLIAELTRSGVSVWLGHTQATYNEVRAAIAAGATAATHLHNAMPGMMNRDPGLVGAVLGDADLVAGVILDGHHLHPATVRATWRSLGCERLMLVSDATAALGLPDGPITLGNQHVILADGAVRLADDSETLAGSGIGLEQCVRNLVTLTGCRLEDALVCATLTPATLLAIDDIGHLDVGAHADITLWNVSTGPSTLAGVICGGRALPGGTPWKL